MKTAYLVCEWVFTDGSGDLPNPHIEIIGIFSTEERAKSECLTNHYFWGEFPVDVAMHEKNVPWPTENPFPISAQ